MDINLDELERLAAQATPGPWKMVDARAFLDDEDFEIRNGQHCIGYGTSEADAAHIVAACNAVPELIARVRELERQRDKLLGMYCNEMSCSWCWLDKVCPHFGETIVRRNPNSEVCREPLRKWLEETAKEAGDETSNR